MNLGQYCRRLREGQGLTVAEVERKTGLSRFALYNLESGKSGVRGPTLIAYLKAIGFEEGSREVTEARLLWNKHRISKHTAHFSKAAAEPKPDEVLKMQQYRRFLQIVEKLNDEDRENVLRLLGHPKLIRLLPALLQAFR